MKQFLIFLFCVMICKQVVSQASYKAAMKQADYNITVNKDYPVAIQLYNAAKAFDPSKSAIVDDSINSVFNLILQQKKEAEDNFNLANAEKKRADNALKISQANQIMYEAQGVVKQDPTLALHLAATALERINNIKMEASFIDDSLLLVDKANRIYYENNFGETIVSDENKPDYLGRFTQAIFWPDEHSVWAITDKAYAAKWTDRNLETKIKLDTAFQLYNFKIISKDSLLIYGIDRGISTSNKTIKIWVITNKKSSFSAYTDSSIKGYIPSIKDAILLNDNRDQTEGWSKRLLVFDDKVYQFNGDGKIAVIDSVNLSVRHIAFAANGNLIAVTNSKPELRIFNTEGKLIDSNYNIGNVPDSLEFSPDNKILLVKQANSLQLFRASDIRYYSTLYFTGSRLQSYQFSSDSRWLLVSTLYGNQQIIILFLYDGRTSEFKVYAQYKCLGSTQTSAMFSRDNKTILSSSDKIRLWSVPTISTQPATVDTKSEFISSIKYDLVEYNHDSTFTVVTFNNRILKFKRNLDGSIKSIDSSYGNMQNSLYTTRLTAFLPLQKTIIVSENGELQLYSLKDVPLQEFLNGRNGFHFDDFTEDQKKRYGIINQ